MATITKKITFKVCKNNGCKTIDLECTSEDKFFGGNSKDQKEHWLKIAKGIHNKEFEKYDEVTVQSLN
jgi:hypothetical protein